MEISVTCSSLGRRITITSVSVRKEEPVRLSDPISRKLVVSCSLWIGIGGGALEGFSMMSAGAGVGSRVLISTAVVGGGGRDGVSVGGTISVGVGRNGWKGVGVGSSGWNGVGVGEAFGAVVTRMNGSGVASDGEAGYTWQAVIA